MRSASTNVNQANSPSLETEIKIAIRPFRPMSIFRNPHIQTIVGAYLRSTTGVSFERVRISTPDNDFIALDFPDVEGALLEENAPIVLLLHGMGGSARQGYACEVYRQLAQAGIRCVGMNYRSCGGEANLQPKTYHGGATEDVETVIRWLREQHPHVPLGIIGVSLGANILVKFLGEAKRDVTVGAAISCPFDLLAGSKALEKGISRFYGQSVLSGLKESIQRKTHQIAHIVDIEKVMAARTLYEYDAVCTAPLHEFPDVRTYYDRCSAKQFVASIQTPTLIIRALDDPFLDPQDVPYKILEKNKWIQAELTSHGGHVGFTEGGLPWRLQWWAHQEVAQFMRKHLVTC